MIRVELQVALCSIAMIGIFGSCSSDPPPPPPPGPESSIYGDVEDDGYGVGDAVIAEPSPFIYEPEEPIEPSSRSRSNPEPYESVEELPPNSEVLEERVIQQDADMGEIVDLVPQEIVADPNEVVYEFAEQRPIYPGGEEAFLADLHRAIVYPQMEKENFIMGKVYLRYIVEKDGSMSNVEIARGVSGGPGLGKEAVRAVKSLTKKYTPAKQNGKPVRFRMTVPVKFQLQ